jgi:hypothetical protein
MSFLSQMSKYVLYVSVILNGTLLMVLAGVIPFLLFLSALINLVFIWYILKSLQNASEVEGDIQELMRSLESFSDHLEQIYSLEMFYGDENLQRLIDHSRGLINDLVDMQEKYYDVEVVEYDESEENPPQQEEE